MKNDLFRNSPKQSIRSNDVGDISCDAISNSEGILIFFYFARKYSFRSIVASYDLISSFFEFFFWSFLSPLGLIFSSYVGM